MALVFNLGMLVLSLINIYNVKAAVYKVLQTFSQRITWVFCSTMVYATKGAPSECQQHWPEYGEEIYSNTLFNR